jgi:hypothetical protein
MNIIVKEGGVKLPDFGSHKAVVSAVEETVANTEAAGPQLKVTFRAEDKSWSISRWYNLVGYVHDENGDIKYNKKTGAPEISKENTEAALNILATDAGRMGAGKAGDNINARDLIGCACGIQVEPNIKGNPSVKSVYDVAYLERILA